jgi:hypothetical protein
MDYKISHSVTFLTYMFAAEEDNGIYRAFNFINLPKSQISDDTMHKLI